MSKYQTGDYIKFDTPEQRKQIVEKLESEGCSVHNTFEPYYKLLRFSEFYKGWFHEDLCGILYRNITDKFWDEYEAEQDLTICLEGAYCPRYYVLEYKLVTVLYDVKDGDVTCYSESCVLELPLECVEISTESVTDISEQLRHIAGSTGGLVAKAKDIDNYNKWLDAVKFNRSQEFEVLTEGFEESLEIIDSLYK